MIFAWKPVCFGRGPRRLLLIAAAVLSAAAVGVGSETAGGDLGSGKVPIAAKIVRYATRLVRKYDGNGDGWLEQEEWRQMGGDPRDADANGDRLITLEELTQYVANYSLRRKIRLRSPGPEIQFVFPLLQTHNDAVSLRQQGTTVPAKPPLARPTPKPRFHVPSADLPEGLPQWFVQRDTDGDGQVSLHEFTAKTPRADMSLFSRTDANGDGLLTARECVNAAKSLPAQPPTSGESAGPPGGDAGSGPPL
jgi:hypothetical protein